MKVSSSGTGGVTSTPADTPTPTPRTLPEPVPCTCANGPHSIPHAPPARPRDAS